MNLRVNPAWLLTVLLFGAPGASVADDHLKVTVTRLFDGPIITQHMDDRMGGNIQGRP